MPADSASAIAAVIAEREAVEASHDSSSPVRPHLPSRRGYSDSTTTTTTVSPPDSLDGQEATAEGSAAYTVYVRSEDTDEPDEFEYEGYDDEGPWPYVPPQAHGAIGPVPYPPEHGAALLADALAAGWPLPEGMHAPDRWILGAPVVPGVHQLSLPCEMAAEASVALHTAQLDAAEAVLRAHKRRAHFSIPDVTVTADSDDGGLTIAEVTVPPAKRRSMVFSEMRDSFTSASDSSTSSAWPQWAVPSGSEPADLFSQWAEVDHITHAQFNPTTSSDEQHVDNVPLPGDLNASEEEPLPSHPSMPENTSIEQSAPVVPASPHATATATGRSASFSTNPPATRLSISSMMEACATPKMSPSVPPVDAMAQRGPHPPQSSAFQEQRDANREARQEPLQHQMDDKSFLPSLTSLTSGSANLVQGSQPASPATAGTSASAASSNDCFSSTARAVLASAGAAQADLQQVAASHEGSVARPASPSVAITGPRDTAALFVLESDEGRKEPSDKKQRRATFSFFGLGLRKKKEHPASLSQAPGALPTHPVSKVVLPGPKQPPLRRVTMPTAPVAASSDSFGAQTPTLDELSSKRGGSQPFSHDLATDCPWAVCIPSFQIGCENTVLEQPRPPPGRPSSVIVNPRSFSDVSPSNSVSGAPTPHSRVTSPDSGSGSGSRGTNTSTVGESQSSSVTSYSDSMVTASGAPTGLNGARATARATTPASSPLKNVSTEPPNQKDTRGEHRSLAARKATWQAAIKATKAEKAKRKAEAAMLKDLQKLDRKVRAHDAKQAKAAKQAQGKREKQGKAVPPLPTSPRSEPAEAKNQGKKGKQNALRKFWPKRKPVSPSPPSPAQNSKLSPLASSTSRKNKTAVRAPSRSSTRSVRRVPSATGKGSTFLVHRSSTRSNRAKTRSPTPQLRRASRHYLDEPEGQVWEKAHAPPEIVSTVPEAVLETTVTPEVSGDSGSVGWSPSRSQGPSSQSSATTMVSDGSAERSAPVLEPKPITPASNSTTVTSSTSAPPPLPTQRKGTYTTRRRTEAQKELDAFVFPRPAMA